MYFHSIHTVVAKTDTLLWAPHSNMEKSCSVTLPSRGHTCCCKLLFAICDSVESVCGWK